MSETDARATLDAPCDENRSRVTHHHYHGCCMGLSGLGPRSASLLWAAGLLAVGTAWLAANAFGIDSWGAWLTPLLLVAMGITILLTMRLDAPR